MNPEIQLQFGTGAVGAPRHDASAVLNMPFELTQIMRQVVQQPFVGAKVLQALPVLMPLQDGRQSFSYPQVTPSGRASVTNLSSTQAGDISLTSETVTQQIVWAKASFTSTVPIDAASAYTNFDPVSMLLVEAKNAIERAYDDSLVFGNVPGQPGVGFRGLTNNPYFAYGTGAANILASAANGTASSRLWSAKTSQQILADLNALVNAVRSNSKGAFVANRLLMPEDIYSFLSSTPYGDLIGRSILSVFLENHPEFGPVTEDPSTSSIVSTAKLASAGLGVTPGVGAAVSAGTDLMIAYNGDKSNLVLGSSIGNNWFAALPPIRVGNYSTLYECYGFFGGLVCPKPVGVASMQGFASSVA